MLAAPMATVQAAKPTLEKVEIVSEGTHTGDSLYAYSRAYLIANWEQGGNFRTDLVANHTSNILTAPGYSNPTTGQAVKFFSSTDEIVFELTFSIDVKVENDGTSDLPALELRMDGEDDPGGTTLRAVYDSARTAARASNKVVYFKYEVQDGDDVFGDGVVIVHSSNPYVDDANNFIIDNGEDVANPVNTTPDDHKWKTTGNADYTQKLSRVFYGRMPPLQEPSIHDGLKYLIDTIRANVRIPGLIKAETHDVSTGYRTDYVDFSTTAPDAAVTETDTQTAPFNVEFLFYNYGVGSDDDGVIADTTRGFEATDITLTVDGTVMTLGSTAADWQVSAPMLIGLDHRDPGFNSPNVDDSGRVKHSSAFKVYRATITPPSGFDGNVEITVPENATMDIVGNLSKASNTLTVPVNTVVDLNIPDAALLAEIKETLNIAAGTAVTSANILGLTSLDLSGSDVSDLTGLEHATNLQTLDLSGTQVSNISALSSLINLTTLDITGTQVSNISALSRLTNLQTLNITGTQVSNISALSRLTNLQTLNISDTQVSDISALSSLINLQTLDISDTQVSNISALSSLTNLQTLDITNTPVSDISALSSLTNLQTLDITGTPVSDISALSSLTNLTVVGFAGSPVVNIPDETLLTGIKKKLDIADDMDVFQRDILLLTELDVGGSDISDLTGLEYATNLEELDLSDTEVLDISALSNLTSLLELSLSGTPVENISALSSLTSLLELSLSGTPVSDISALSSLTSLLELSLSGTPVENITPLSNLTNLKKLDLSDTQVSDISPLSK